MTTLKPLGDSPQQRVLWMALFAHGLEGRRGLPYVLVGEPGTVKTSIVRRLSRMAGLHYEGVLGSLRSPMDYLGIPVPQRMKLDETTQHLAQPSDFDVQHDEDFNLIGETLRPGSELLYMHYAPAGFAVRAAAAQRSLLFFDEANTMPPRVQAAMLRVLFEGVVGELDLPKGVRMLLAMNKADDAAGGWDIAPALANRMGWLEWEGTSVAKFGAYLIGSGGRGSDAMPVEPIDPAVLERDVDVLWGAAWAESIGQIMGFLQARGELFHKKPAAADASKPWPSSRTWDFMAHALAGCKVFGLSALEEEMACSAFVGAGAYGEFFTWSNANDLPDYGALLDGSATFEHSPSRIDRTAAVISGCSALVIPEDAVHRPERAAKMWEFMADMVKKSPDATDVCLPAIVRLTKAKLMVGNQAAYKVIGKTEPMMEAASLNPGAV